MLRRCIPSGSVAVTATRGRRYAALLNIACARRMASSTAASSSGSTSIWVDSKSVHPNPHGEQLAVPPGFSTITEGGAVALFKEGKVFYNQVQVLNRDMSVNAIAAWDEWRQAAERGLSVREIRRAWASRGVVPPKELGSMPPEYQKLPPMRILEALSATGLRSIRFARELPTGRVDLVVANDIESAAVAAIRANVAHNRLAAPSPLGADRPIVVGNAGDASIVMHLASRGLAVLPSMREWMTERAPVPPGAKPAGREEAAPGSAASAASAAATEEGTAAAAAKTVTQVPPFMFDVIDLDPYGTAAPFLDAALGAVAEGGLLCITCTDMAVLAGNHMDVCRGKYGSVPVKGRHYGEQALRVVLASIERAANVHKRSITPIMSVCVDFYVRVFVTVHSSAQDVNEVAARLANVHQCSGCDSYWLWPLGKGSGYTKGLFKPTRGSGKRAPTSAAAAAAEDAEDVDVAAAAPAEADSGAAATATATADAADAAASGGAGAGAGAASGAIRAGTKRKRERVLEKQAQRETADNLVHVIANSAPDIPSCCPHCGRSIVIGGPLWLGPMHEPSFVNSVVNRLSAAFGTDGKGPYGAGGELTPAAQGISLSASAAAAYDLRPSSCVRTPAHDGGSNNADTVAASRKRLLGIIRSIQEEELDIPLYYDVATLCSRMRLPVLPLPDLQAALVNCGYRVSGSHCTPNCVKTDAPNEAIWDILRVWARLNSKDGVSAPAPTPAAADAAAEGGTASAAPQPSGPRYLPDSVAKRRAARTVQDALLMAHHGSVVPVDAGAELFEWPERVDDMVRARRAKGTGARFMPNPGEKWGPKSRAYGKAGLALEPAAQAGGESPPDDGAASKRSRTDRQE